MRFRILFIVLILNLPGFTQVTIEKQTHDFGDMYSGSQSYVDFYFTNNSEKTQFLLTIDKPRDVYYVFSAKMMMPDSSISIRLKVNTSKKGKFRYEVPIFFSEPREAIVIVLTGNVKELPQNSLTACPDFNATPPTGGSTEFMVTIRVLDSVTRLPIKNAQVYLVERGEVVGDYKTNKQGTVRRPIPYGYYYITANEEKYKSNFFDGYLNFKRNYVEILLSQEEQEEIILPNEDSVFVDVVIQSPLIKDTIVEEVETVEVAKDTIIESIDVSLSEIPDTLFDEKHFKYSNITFILDVSSSMNAAGKLDLLKLSMIELVKILRPGDKVSLLKYSSEVDVLLSGASGDEKDKIISVVRDLKTSGYTAGGNAIKAGYKINRKEYIENGNNLVIMVTDGIFNKGDKDYLKTIEKNYNEKGIRFSVVGIKTSEFVTAHMLNIVSKGGGGFVRILTIADAKSKLIDEIKRTSFRGEI